MKIRLAVIPPDELATFFHLVGDLRSRVEAGDMDGVDTATEKLLTATAKMRLVDITEERWREFLAKARVEDATFQSDYVGPGKCYSQFFPDAATEAMVLQFPFLEQEDDDV